MIFCYNLYCKILYRHTWCSLKMSLSDVISDTKGKCLHWSSQSFSSSEDVLLTNSSSSSLLSALFSSINGPRSILFGLWGPQTTQMSDSFYPQRCPIYTHSVDAVQVLQGLRFARCLQHSLYASVFALVRVYKVADSKGQLTLYYPLDYLVVLVHKMSWRDEGGLHLHLQYFWVHTCPSDMQLISDQSN